MKMHGTNSSGHLSKSEEVPCDLDLSDMYPITLANTESLLVGMGLLVIALLTISTNFLFLLIVFKSKQLQKLNNLLLITLSISDLFTGVTVIPVAATSYFLLITKNFPCIIFWYSQIGSYGLCVVSFWNIVFISCERYLAIIHPFLHHRVVSKTKLISATVTMWVLCVAFATLNQVCGFDDFTAYRITWLVMANLCLVVYLAVIYFYVRIFKVIRQVKRRIASENTIDTCDRSVRQNTKSATTTAILVATFTCCYVPQICVHIYNLWLPIITGTSTTDIAPVLIPVAQAALLLNSFVNPIVYFFRMSTVRNEFRRLFCGERFAHPEITQVQTLNTTKIK